ncbi:hypothetical protein FGF66_06730 [Chlorobaculum thiosulfatiphilum]|uniref:Uncharacterized protein n=1 Tax=Chlorobaculum thiosulfatiphilum TaxID=115852 RepID=A0A5C4S664_CHLTI|nr:hypothetical protein [Chlorobaculum thiosulfatiphilum]TNJ38954.1 hypothetical protein FGF66_06730 [Chlorobaculum thiosulfatiphilum]
MSIILGFLAMIFAVSDLLGENRTRKLEDQLRTAAKNQFEQITCLFKSVLFRLKPLLLSLVCLSLLSPGVIFVFSDNPNGFIALAAFVVPTLGVLVLRDYFIPIWQSILDESSIDDQIEGKIIRFVENRISEVDEKSENDDGLGIIAFLFTSILAISIIFSIACRFLILFVMTTAWTFWGWPVVSLASFAEKLGNPSYFKVGKFIIYVFTFIVTIWVK